MIKSRNWIFSNFFSFILSSFFCLLLTKFIKIDLQRVHWPVQVALTECRKLVAYITESYFSQFHKPEVQDQAVTAEWFHPEASPLGVQMAASHRVLMWSSLCAPASWCFSVSKFPLTIGHHWVRATLRASFYLHPLFKAPSPNSHMA